MAKRLHRLPICGIIIKVSSGTSYNIVNFSFDSHFARLTCPKLFPNRYMGVDAEAFVTGSKYVSSNCNYLCNARRHSRFTPRRPTVSGTGDAGV